MAIFIKREDGTKEFGFKIISEIENGAKEIEINLDENFKMEQVDFVNLMQFIQAHNKGICPRLTSFKSNSLSKFNFEITDTACGYKTHTNIFDSMKSDMVVDLRSEGEHLLSEYVKGEFGVRVQFIKENELNLQDGVYIVGEKSLEYMKKFLPISTRVK